MDTVTNYLPENSLWTVIIVIVAIVFIVGILKSLFKMAMVIAVIGLILVVFFDFEPQKVMDNGKELANDGTELLEDNIASSLLTKLSEQDFFIKEEDGETIIEIESLGVKYNLDDLLGQLKNERQDEINELIKMTELEEERVER